MVVMNNLMSSTKTKSILLKPISHLIRSRFNKYMLITPKTKSVLRYVVIRVNLRLMTKITKATISGNNTLITYKWLKRKKRMK
jgi:hypothetical protein